MNNNKTDGVEYFADLLAQTSSLLNLSLSEIRKKYEDYPHCQITYFEGGIEEKSIEIRFDKEEITMACTFNTIEKCNSVYLFPDKNEVTEKFIKHLRKSHKYNFLKNRWKVMENYIKIQKLSKSANDICFMLHC